ncbi:hypothetical protein PMPD1_2661 [Paramixta manurensis]|uniref:Arc family DNA-binding protein n=1 Tax=Paramixta manurensis TaxID=2740817 RepID=A0A6M8UFA9_9GAMM|nr:hypothetical protein PMPD1_2661 [Erwiniaceae bacterium PD-1]
MADTVSLTLKIDPALKEMMKSLALENQVSVSQEVSQRLRASIEAAPQPVVDSQNPEDDTVPPLTHAELKQLRALLKKTRKKK